jgi:glycosyltransferase involved in cell wall biosynthesis
MKYLIVTDIPTPWREPIFEKVHRKLSDSFGVVYCKNNEKRRLWHVPLGSHPKTILPAITVAIGGKERFFNPGIVSFLIRHRPRIALIFSNIKDPTVLLALVLCRILGTKIILMSDTWLGRDRGINWLQRLARHVVYRWFGDAFVGVSHQTLAMFEHFNRRIVKEQLFLSPLCADNDYFQRRLQGREVIRRFDVMFAGRIVSEKNVVFFAEVCARIKERLGKCSALILGEGEDRLKTQMRAIFEAHGVDCTFAGFIQHDALPEYYAQAKLLLLPTAGDCWGVVLNEAMVAGTPTVTTEWTAAAGELVLNGYNGYVLPLDVEVWCIAISKLLSDHEMWESFSKAAKASAGEYTFEKAAQGIVAAMNYLDGHGGNQTQQSRTNLKDVSQRAQSQIPQ